MQQQLNGVFYSSLLCESFVLCSRTIRNQNVMESFRTFKMSTRKNKQPLLLWRVWVCSLLSCKMLSSIQINTKNSEYCVAALLLIHFDFILRTTRTEPRDLIWFLEIVWSSRPFLGTTSTAWGWRSVFAGCGNKLLFIGTSVSLSVKSQKLFTAS